MNFCWSTIIVSSMEKSLEFYSEVLGLTINSRRSVGDVEIAFLGSGETKIELMVRGDVAEPAYGRGISLGFRVDSLDMTVKMLEKKQIPVAEGPFQPAPGIRFLFIHDPDGLRIQLVEETRQ